MNSLTILWFLYLLIAIGLFVLIDWLLKLYMVWRDLRELRMLNSEIRRECVTVDFKGAGRALPRIPAMAKRRKRRHPPIDDLIDALVWMRRSRPSTLRPPQRAENAAARRCAGVPTAAA